MQGAHLQTECESPIAQEGWPSAKASLGRKEGLLLGRQEGLLVEALHSLGLEESLLDQPWSTLSGGQSQRLYLAIMVARRPQILLLDEVTSACDPASTKLVEQLVQASGCGSVWITHNVEQAERIAGARFTFQSGQP